MVQRMTIWFVSVPLVFLISISTQAVSPDYYTVQDLIQRSSPEASVNPLELFSDVVTAANTSKLNLNLMAWDHHQEELPDPTVPYNRIKHFGVWVRDPSQNNCQNTRARVLIRDSEVPVSFSANGCNVLSGRWQDPYSNRQYTQASDMQIDHVVPLKNSYMSGAWKWDARKRCLYANFTSNDFHLLAVYGIENMKKGDKTPEKFMPSNAAYSCEYLSIWLKIKLIWNLTMAPSEARAISQLVKQNHCDTQPLEMSAQELRQQRQSILSNVTLCQSAH